MSAKVYASNADKQRAYRLRQAAQIADDRRILAAVDRLMRETGQLMIPSGVSREEWAEFIDREEERRTRRDGSL